MKVWNVSFQAQNEGRRFLAKLGTHDMGVFTVKLGELVDDSGRTISVHFTLREILRFDFCPIGEYDTAFWEAYPIDGLVSVNFYGVDSSWEIWHYAGLLRGEPSVWTGGRTSQTARGEGVRLVCRLIRPKLGNEQ